MLSKRRSEGAGLGGGRANHVVRWDHNSSFITITFMSSERAAQGDWEVMWTFIIDGSEILLYSDIPTSSETHLMLEMQQECGSPSNGKSYSERLISSA